MARRWSAFQRLTIAFVIGILAGTGRAAFTPPVPTLNWGACPDEWNMLGNSSKFLQCATATVPMDYTASCAGGANITLAVARLPASPKNASQTKLGTIWLNPGGPGYSGLDFLATIAILRWIPDAILERFDLASWDPRGVGARGTHVQCFDTEAEKNASLAGLPDPPRTAKEEAQVAATYAKWAEQCGKRNGKLLSHVSTADTATDLDLLRQAVGDAGLYYWGVSYGTVLGQVYANMFPDKVKALVIDSVVDPAVWFHAGPPGDTQTGLPVGMRIGQDLGFPETLMRMLELCGQSPAGNCPFSGGSYAQTRIKWNQLVTALRERGVIGLLANADGNNSAPSNLTYGALLGEVARNLYSANLFNGLAKTLQVAWTYRNSPPVSGSDVPPLPPPSGEVVTVYADNGEQSAAVGCGESPESRDAASYARQAREEWPRGEDFSVRGAWGGLACYRWPAKAKHIYHGPWNKTTSAPLLVVSITHDPATPIVNAERAAFERLSKARLLKVEGWGHGVVGTSKCAEDHIARYFVDGTLPAEDTVCKQDHVPFSGTKPGRRAMEVAEVLNKVLPRPLARR